MQKHFCMLARFVSPNGGELLSLLGTRQKVVELARNQANGVSLYLKMYTSLTSIKSSQEQTWNFMCCTDYVGLSFCLRFTNTVRTAS